MPMGEPKFLQHVVGLVEKLPIETLEVSQIMGVEVPATKLLNQGRDFAALPAHPPKIESKVQSPKSKVRYGTQPDQGPALPWRCCPNDAGGHPGTVDDSIWVLNLRLWPSDFRFNRAVDKGVAQVSNL